MKNIILSLKIMTMNIGSVIFMCILLTVSMVLILSDTIMLFVSYHNLSEIKFLAESGAYLESCIPKYTKQPIDFNKLIDLASEEGVREAFSTQYIGTNGYTLIYDPDNSLGLATTNIRHLAITGELTAHFKPQLSKGRNITEGQNANGNYEVIISQSLESALPLGSVFEFQDHEGFYNGEHFTVEVVGIIKNYSTFFTGKGGTPSLSTVYMLYNAEEPLMIFNFQEENWRTRFPWYEAIFYLDDELDDGEKPALLERLSDEYGIIYSFADLYEQYKETIADEFLSRIPKSALLGAVVLLTVCGCTAINTVSHFDKYSLCILCGSTRGKCIYMIAVMNLFIFTASAIIAVPAFDLYFKTSTELTRQGYLSDKMILIVAVFFAVIYFLSLITPAVILRKNPITIYLGNKQ